MRKVLLLLATALSVSGQTVSYFNQQLLTKPSAAADRAFLGITNGGGSASNLYFTNVYGIAPGTNVTFTTNAGGVVSINTGGGGSSQTNIYATNLLGLLPGNNVTFSTNAAGLTINSTGGGGSGAPLNGTNVWTGTNTFTKPVYGTQLQIGVISIGAFGARSFRDRISAGSGGPDYTGVNLYFDSGTDGAESVLGAGLYVYDDTSTYQEPLELHGNPVVLDTAGGSDRLYINGTERGRMDVYGNWIVGKTASIGNTAGNGEFTGILLSASYGRDQAGLIVSSNSWARSGLGILANGDTFGYGDNWYLNSNGVPFIVIKDAAGNIHTNPLDSSSFVLKSGDYMQGPLTNLSSVMDIRGSNTTATLSFEIPDPLHPGLWLGTSIEFSTAGLTIAAPTILNGGLHIEQFVGVNAGGIDYNGQFYGDANRMTNFPGLTTNFIVMFGNGAANTLQFTNGLLVAINGNMTPVHGPSLIQPAGAGYILQPNGGTLLLP